MTIVPSSVDINCMPVIATIAMPATLSDSRLAALDPADMGTDPTETSGGRRTARSAHTRGGSGLGHSVARH